jgi:hypothetical protein
VAKSSKILWTDNELVSAVEFYLFMLQAQRAGLAYPKDTGTKLLLSGPLNTRNDASLRYRMRNISAVISEMGGPVLAEYSPAQQVGVNVRMRLRASLLSEISLLHAPIREGVHEANGRGYYRLI